jgi:putative membrane protein insertion efficiency factor
MFRTIQTLSKALLLGLIRAYQLVVSPVIPPSCRFTPSCSHYAAEAVMKHGSVRGTALAMGRICRCHPFNPGGHDPVPTVMR